MHVQRHPLTARTPGSQVRLTRICVPTLDAHQRVCPALVLDGARVRPAEHEATRRMQLPRLEAPPPFVEPAIVHDAERFAERLSEVSH